MATRRTMHEHVLEIHQLVEMHVHLRARSPPALYARGSEKRTARLLKRLQRIEELPPADQRAVLKLVDAMLETRRRTTPPARTKRKAS